MVSPSNDSESGDPRMRSFDPHARDYHAANAAWLARIARLAYLPEAKMKSTIGGWGMTPGAVQGVYLFGAPRVGNLDFARDYDRQMG